MKDGQQTTKCEDMGQTVLHSPLKESTLSPLDLELTACRTVKPKILAM